MHGANFFDGTYWNFFHDADPTHGSVKYVSKQTAIAKKYIDPSGNPSDPVFIRIENTTKTANVGRESVRLESKKLYNSGLFMLYLEHMPTGCGTWPAFWTSVPGPPPKPPKVPVWPNRGEIDIIEGVNLQTNNLATLHTSHTCQFGDASHTKFGGKKIKFI